MTTNLVAAVVITLVTNIVPSDNAKWGRDWGQWYPEGGGPSRIVEPATEHYTTTNIVEHTVITVQLQDGPHTFTVDRTLSSVTAILRKLENWEPAGVRTNDVNPPKLVWTNTVWGADTNIYVIPLDMTNYHLYWITNK